MNETHTDRIMITGKTLYNPNKLFVLRTSNIPNWFNIYVLTIRLYYFSFTNQIGVLFGLLG